MEPRITIEGTPYVIPTLASMDLDEHIVLFDYTSMTIDQMFDVEGLNPRLIKGLLHVAIQRSDPALSDREIKEMLKVNYMNIIDQFVALAESAEDPTQGGQPPLESDSKPRTDEQTESSGITGAEDSVPSPEPSSHVSTGAPISDSTATSDQGTLVS